MSRSPSAPSEPNAPVREHFSPAALRKIYHEQISETRAVGKDGTTQKQFKANLDQELEIISRKIENCTYEFTIFREKLISKGAGKLPRIISIPTIRDRVTLRAINNILMTTFPEARVRLPHAYIKNIKHALNDIEDDFSFVRIDIRDYYPSINHKILLGKIRTKLRGSSIPALVSAAISTPTGSGLLSENGVPQGLSISNILSSIYLQKLDESLSDKFTYFRYVDDILIICQSDQAEMIFEYIRSRLRALRLKCHNLGVHGKSQIVSVGSGIEYLGYHITPLKISVRKSSFTRMMENILGVLTGYKHALNEKKSAERLVWRLNLKITGCVYAGTKYGWVFFFSQVDDIGQLIRLDKFVTEELDQRNLGHLRPKIKKFTRTYHEIRRNFRQSKYIPRFDDLSTSDMATIVSEALGVPLDEIMSSRTEEEIRTGFFHLVKREITELERDLIEATS